MKLTHLSVTNYRGLRDISLPMSRFACLIGRNNAGKSTVLQAISLFFTGTKLYPSDYFDPHLPIRIALTFSEISSDDLARLAEDHRERIESLLVGGSVTFVRHYDTDGKGKLRYSGLVPKEERFHSSAVAALLKGQKGKALVSAVEERFPELKDKLDSSATQAKAKDAIQSLAESLPASAKEVADSDLPTGIDSSITALLPECIYIPAVKNLADDTKTSQTTPFGKILGILMDAVEPKLGDVAAMFHDLHAKFNRIHGPDGSVSDNRLDEVRLIESTLRGFVRESFASVDLEITIPPPELRTILQTAQIMVDDGVAGPIESKGDGLRRAVVFAVLRSYVTLSQSGSLASDAAVALQDRHLLLFEEPEIYLHPSAQQTLFDALKLFARRNHVVITTHSPSFFGPDGTDNFVRLSKVTDAAIATKPFTVAARINMDDVKEKDRFQLICYENNNAAFFFDTVVLVEGDSDYIVIPHIASLVEPSWSLAKANIRFARIGGKASIRRYREFFQRFGVRVLVLTDLDILVKDFEQLEPSEELQRLQSDLLQCVDKVIEGEVEAEPNGKQVRAAHDSGDLRAVWRRVRQLRQDVNDGKATFEQLDHAIQEFFSWERKQSRLEALKDSTDPTLVENKRKLLAELRKVGAFVLEKGSLEAYYPAAITGTDKPSMAQQFCREVVTKEQVLSLCDEHEQEGCRRKELELICECLATV